MALHSLLWRGLCGAVACFGVGCAVGVSLGVAVWGWDIIGAGMMHKGGPGASGALYFVMVHDPMWRMRFAFLDTQDPAYYF